MRLIGCDLHASQQSIAMLDRDTGVVVEKTLRHEPSPEDEGFVLALFVRVPEEPTPPPPAGPKGGSEPTRVVGQDAANTAACRPP